MSRARLVIAIDGPAASGKSTTARLVAERLGYLHVDTGAMYRAVTLKVLRRGLAPDDAEGIRAMLATTSVQLAAAPAGQRVLLDGQDVTAAIRSPDVTRAVSVVSGQREVRRAMVREQRAMGAEGGIVLEGRDIGTVVFPDADLKFFVVASLSARALRRQRELAEQGVEAALGELEGEIARRDRHDSTRSESPLRRAPDAVDLDTSEMTIEEQVAFVVRRVRELEEKRAQA